MKAIAHSPYPVHLNMTVGGRWRRGARGVDGSLGVWVRNGTLIADGGGDGDES